MSLTPNLDALRAEGRLPRSVDHALLYAFDLENPAEAHDELRLRFAAALEDLAVITRWYQKLADREHTQFHDDI